MIKSIVFDWGGMLIKKPTSGIMSYCAKELDVSKKTFTEVYLRYKEDFQKGEITENMLWVNICQDLEVAPPKQESLWVEAFKKVYSEKQEMFSLVRLLKKSGYKTGFLSNTEKPAMKFFHNQNYDMFDVTVFSCTEGTVKPDKKIYQILLERLNLQPGEIVFIDDKEDNVVGAEQVGMIYVLFKNYQLLIEDLKYYSVKL